MNKQDASYHILYKKLAADIQTGVYPEDKKLPAELKLCELYGVSRITVRQALSLLESDGYISRHQGRGTFVKPRNFAQKLSTIYSFTEELKKMNSVPGVRVLSSKIVQPELVVSKALDLEIDAPAVEVCRLRLADGVPFAFETSYLPMDLFKDATIAEIETDGLYATLKKHSGIAPDHAEEVFEATLAPKEVAYNLRREGKFAVMRVLRRATCQNRPVEYCITYLEGDKYRYCVELPFSK